MNSIRDKLYISGMDRNAPHIAREFQLGLELTHFAWAAQFDVPDSIQVARQQMSEIQRFWFHAPFAELSPCAIDPLVRDLTKKRFLQSISVASSLNIRNLVFHAGFIPLVYQPEWFIPQSIVFWKELLQEVPNNLHIALENVMEPSPEYQIEIIREVNDPRLSLCLDVGHANAECSITPPLQWIDSMAPWLSHVHIHNNLGTKDLHANLGDGNIPMHKVINSILSLAPSATFTIESENCAPSIQWLYDNHFLE